MGGLSDDGWYAADRPAPAFDLGPSDIPIDYWIDDETAPGPWFPVPSYAGGTEPNPEYGGEDDYDWAAWGRACRDWFQRMRDTGKYEEMPPLEDFRVRAVEGAA